MWRLAQIVFALIVTLPVVTAAQTPKDEFQIGLNAYLYGDFPEVIRRLRPLIEPTVRLTNPADLVKCYEQLALAYYFLNQREDAKDIFGRLLRFRPDQKLNPILVPADVIVFYGKVRDELAEELQRQRELLAKERRENEERRRLKNLREVHIERRRNSRFVAAMPFGLGQFQNNDTALGVLFLGTELAAAGLSLGLYASVENLRKEGRFAREDISRVRSLQTAQVISGGIALGMMVGGIVHALWTYQDQVTTSRKIVEPPSQARGLLSWEF